MKFKSDKIHDSDNQTARQGKQLNKFYFEEISDFFFRLISLINQKNVHYHQKPPFIILPFITLIPLGKKTILLV